jgi:hypothetical protein
MLSLPAFRAASMVTVTVSCAFEVSLVAFLVVIVALLEFISQLRYCDAMLGKYPVYCGIQ